MEPMIQGMAGGWRIVADGFIATGLGLVIGGAYARAYRGLLLSTTFVHTCAVTVLLVALAVATVREAGQQAQALSFALVGLLGLIRFRTVVRDTREFSFIFVAIVSGTMVGAGHEMAAILGCAAALALLLTLERVGFGAPSSLSLRVKISGSPENSSAYTEALLRLATRVDPTSVRSRSGEKSVYVFELIGNAGVSMDAVGATLGSIPGTDDVVISRIQRGKAGSAEED